VNKFLLIIRITDLNQKKWATHTPTDPHPHIHTHLFREHHGVGPSTDGVFRTALTGLGRVHVVVGHGAWDAYCAIHLAGLVGITLADVE